MYLISGLTNDIFIFSQLAAQILTEARRGVPQCRYGTAQGQGNRISVHYYVGNSDVTNVI